MNTFFVDLKKIFNFRILLSVLAVTALCFFSHLTAFDHGTQPTLLELTANALFKNERLYTCQEIVSNFDTSYWFYIALPVVVSMPTVIDFYEEWFGGRFYLNLHRQKIIGYCVSKTAAYSITAAAIFLIGVALFIFPVSLIFPSESTVFLNEIYPSGFFMYMLARLSNAAAAAAVCPLVTVIILILIKEKFLSLSVPMLINYMTAQLGSFLNIKAFTENNMELNKVIVLFPYYQFTLSRTFEETFGISFFVWYSAWALFLVLCASVLFYLVKRRVKKGG